MFVAYLRTFARMGLKAIPMRADTGPIGGDLSHEFIILAETGESAVFCHKDWSTSRAGRDTISTTLPTCRAIVEWTSLYAATDEMHDEAAFEAMPRTSAACRRAASRSAISSISAPSTPSR
jgi:prolyl-tRNA synthetase